MKELEYEHINEVMEFYSKRAKSIVENLKAMPGGHFKKVVGELTPLPTRENYEEFIGEYASAVESLYEYFCLLEEYPEFREKEFKSPLGYFPDLCSRCDDGAKGYVHGAKKRLGTGPNRLEIVLEKIRSERKKKK